jgi:hypothetical protein
LKRGAGRETGNLLRTKRERTVILLFDFRVKERGHAGSITCRPVLQQRLKASSWKKKNREKFKNAHRDTSKRLRRVPKKKKKKKTEKRTQRHIDKQRLRRVTKERKKENEHIKYVF